MYPTVMPQSELLARLENNASMTDKSLALRDSRKQRQATVEDEPTSSSEESESDSESDSGSDSDIAAPPKRPISPPKPTGPLRDEQRPNRKISTEKSAQPRPKSAAPVLRRTQRSPHRISSDASVAMASSGSEPLKPSRPRSATSPVDHAHQPITRRPTSRTPSPKSSEVTAKKPNALSFLDPDSPQVTEEQIRRVMAETSGQWSPRSVSSSSSSNDSISHRSVAETDATTPEQSVNGDISVQFHGNSFFQPGSSPSRSRSGSQVQRPRSRQEAEEQEHKYGTPEMARGPAKHPHIHPKELQPRLAAPGQGHAKHLPRAEKLPMSGYELLAAKLSSPQSSRSRRRSYSKTMPTEEGEPMIKPIYRRFENLNHRLLLHLQDELSELEEQLHRLDTADTQTRRLANCILPASRRADFMAGGELQWHKADILGKVGYKLGQYNHVLSTFKDTQSLPSASLDDVETYRTYLATRNPIAEIETRFLDPADDLVCLAGSSRPSSPSNSFVSPTSEDMLTPMPLKTTFGFSPSPSTTAAPSRKSSVDTYEGSSSSSKCEEPTEPIVAGKATNPSTQPACLGALAIIGPILAFPIVTDFVGRMAVVLVVGLAIAALRRRMIDLGMWEEGGEKVLLQHGGESRDGTVLLGAYGVVMAVIAMLF